MTRVRNSALIAGFAVALAFTMPVAAQAPGVVAPPAAAQSPGEIASDYYARFILQASQLGLRNPSIQGRVPAGMADCVARVDHKPLGAVILGLLLAEFTPDELRQIDAYASTSAAAKQFEVLIVESRQAAGLPVAAPVTYDENDLAVIETFENGPLVERLIDVLGWNSGRSFSPSIGDHVTEVFERCRG